MVFSFFLFAAAVLTTYSASVMLHGLNFQLGAVLLSLGLFFYVEDSLRTKLSSMFNASVGSSRSDGFRHKEWELPVVMFNLACGGLAVANLAYLGVMFDQDNTMVLKAFWENQSCLSLIQNPLFQGGGLLLAAHPGQVAAAGLHVPPRHGVPIRPGEADLKTVFNQRISFHFLELPTKVQ